VATRWGQELDLGGVVEDVGDQRLGEPERLGVALGVVGRVVEVVQVQVGQDVGRVLEGGHVGVGRGPVQGQGEAAAAPPVEGDGRRPLLVQRQVGRGQPLAVPPRRRRANRKDWGAHYHADPGFMAAGDHDPRRQRWRRSPSSPARD
jgi:hypothetical protein